MLLVLRNQPRKFLERPKAIEPEAMDDFYSQTEYSSTQFVGLIIVYEIFKKYLTGAKYFSIFTLTQTNVRFKQSFNTDRN